MKRKFAMLVFFLFIFQLFGANQLRDYLQSQIRYWGVEQKVTSTDLDRLVDLKRKADQPGLNQQEREKAYTELFHFAQKLRGLPEGPVPAATAASLWSPGQSPVPLAVHFAKSGQLGNFTKRGSGTIPMILIPDLGIDWTVFDSFMQRNHSDFLFYAVTLPGFGGTAPPRPHQKLDFGTREWWKNAQVAILNLIAKEKLNRPILLGHQAGAYLAMTLALQRPDLVRGAIVLNGLLYAPLPGITQSVTAAERVRFVNSWTPAELFPNTSQEKYRAVMLQNAAWFCKDKQRQEYLAGLIARGRTGTWWNYFAELATTDLSNEIKKLKVPMLVLPSVHGRDSPGFESSRIALDQWNPLDHSKSSLPITVNPIEDCRAYATEDQPAKLDEAIRNWTAKLNGSSRSAVQFTPRAATRLTQIRKRQLHLAHRLLRLAECGE